MDNLYFNLSEEEFSSSRKVLLWGFSGLFFIGGVYILINGLFYHKTTIPPVLSVAPFGISFVVALISSLATFKRKDLFFSIDDNKIEFRYGLLNPKRHQFNWIDIVEITMPMKQRKALLLLRDGTSYTIDLTWLQRKKSSIIKKHIYHAARSKNLNVRKMNNLESKH
jgi:hypothetical protein